MDSHSYRNVDEEKPYEKNMDSHSIKDVHDEDPKEMVRHSYRNVHD